MEKPLVRRKQRIIVTMVPPLVFLGLLVPCCTQTKAPAEANKICSRISDSESGRALPDARIHVVYRSDKETSTAKEELDVKTDKDGFAEIPKLKVERLGVDVKASGYRECWLWVRSDRCEELVSIRLEKWVRSAKQ